MHLFCYLVHVTNVRSLIWIRVYAHADQLPQLKDRKTCTEMWMNLLISYWKRLQECLSNHWSPGQELGISLTQMFPGRLQAHVHLSHVPRTLQKGQEEPFPPNLQHWRFKSSTQASGFCVITHNALVAYTYLGVPCSVVYCGSTQIAITTHYSDTGFFFKKIFFPRGLLIHFREPEQRWPVSSDDQQLTVKRSWKQQVGGASKGAQRRRTQRSAPKARAGEVALGRRWHQWHEQDMDEGRKNEISTRDLTEVTGGMDFSVQMDSGKGEVEEEV